MDKIKIPDKDIIKAIEWCNDRGFTMDDVPFMIIEYSINKSQLIGGLENYIKFLGEELGELAVLQSIRGWKSSRIEEGKKLRKEIKELKSKL